VNGKLPSTVSPGRFLPGQGHGAGGVLVSYAGQPRSLRMLDRDGRPLSTDEQQARMRALLPVLEAHEREMRHLLERPLTPCRGRSRRLGAAMAEVRDRQRLLIAALRQAIDPEPRPAGR
jgi:hypothetical protein